MRCANAFISYDKISGVSIDFFPNIIDITTFDDPFSLQRKDDVH